MEIEPHPSERTGTQPLTIGSIWSEGSTVVRSSLVAVVPLAGLLIAVGTGFLYLVGIHTYDFYRDFYGIPIHVLDPSLYDILARGAQASVPGAIFLGFFVLLGSVGLYSLFAWLLIISENDLLRRYNQIVADPSCVEEGSRRERLIRRRILKKINDGWSLNNKQSIVRISHGTIVSIVYFGLLLGVPSLLFGAQFIGYTSIANDRLIGWLMSSDNIGTTYLYTTDKGTVCGVILVEGAKGIAVGLVPGNSVMILSPEEIRKVSRVDDCPFSIPAPTVQQR